MTGKSKPEIKLGATVRLRVHSGEIVEGQVVHMWEEKSVQMVRVAFRPTGLQRPCKDAGRCKQIIADLN